METFERVTASPRLPADPEVSRSVGQASTNQLGAQSHNGTRQDQRQPGLETDGLKLQELWGHSLQPGFQDSNLSPALPLMVINAGVEHMFTEYSLFQQSDNEFAPLRAYPDISMVSERCHFQPRECTTRVSERGSLSQHPLAQDTILSEEGEKSCGSLSQHSFSPKDDGKQKETVHSPSITTTPDRQEVPSRDDRGKRKKDSETVKDAHDRPVGEAAEDETLFLTKDVPAQHLLKLLQKDVGMPSGSSSPISSASERSVKIAASFSKESKSTQVCKPAVDKGGREGPTGEASLPQCQTQRPDRDLQSEKSGALSPEVCNITVGLRSTQPDESSDVLHRELLSEVERQRSLESESKAPQRKSPPHGQSVTPHRSDMSSVTGAKLCGVPWTKSVSSGLSRGHREQDLCSSGSRPGIDGSYLGFLPQSQSTPGVFSAPPKSTNKAKVGHFSAVESKKEHLYQLSTGISPQPTSHAADVQHSDTSNQCQEEATTTAKVQSLPSLSYIQKVDAWRANQASGKMPLFDSISPKKKAYDAASDTLDRIPSQQVRSLQQPPVLNAGNQDVTQSSSSEPSSSSSYSRRGEAVGSAPSDRDNAVSATKLTASPPGRSQSHSSLSTVVLVKKDQQTETHAEEKKSQTQDNVPHQPSTTALPSTLASLGHFSDVSPDRDLTLSSSPGSHNSGTKLGTSIGTSSVVSLEVDNYAPHWTSKPSTPPPPLRTQELNIEERIPLYLHNLGIHQSPSTILKPFAPKGPIREPEFSPTDLCTVKGSIGTPTKSTQPSEDGSPHKEAFSRSSILSVASSISIPFSLDSLGPPTSIPERTRLTLPSLDMEAIQSERGLHAPSSLPDEDSYPSTLQTALQQQRDGSLTSSQNTSQPWDRFDSDLSVSTEARRRERDLESPLRTSRTVEQSTEASSVSSRGSLDIQRLLSQAENRASVRSSGPCTASPTEPNLHSDEDRSLSLKGKNSRLQDSSSSTNGDHRTQPSLLWTTSSSDSMLTSEKLRESSIGQESMTSSGQLYNPSTQPLVNEESTDSRRRPDRTVGRAAGSSFALSQSARRAEPEGCSAAPPDNAVPPQPPVIKAPPAVSAQQLVSTPPDTTGIAVEEKQTSLEDPVQSSSSSPVLEDTDQGAMSDGSSGSSLAVRVAKLLQSESPATMVSSTASITDQEESKAREWIMLKISGQQCEPLELDKEDRRRIEEIKRELLLKNPIESQGSTETGSSAASSVGANIQPSHPRSDLHHPGVQLQNPPRPDLEAQIREIAAREGVTLPWTNPRALASITVAPRWRSTSPSPSTSPAPSASPAPEPLHLTDFDTGPVQHPKVHSHQLLTADETSTEPAYLSEPRDGNLNLPSQNAPGDQKRQETVGGQFEGPPPRSLSSVIEDVNTDDNMPSFRREDSVPGVGHEAEQATGSSMPLSPARIGQVSRVHLSSATGVPSSHSDAAVALPRKEFVPLRRSSSAATSPDEGVGLSSPPEWYDAKVPVRQRGPEGAQTSSLFKTSVSQENMTSTSTSPHHSVAVLPRLSNSGSPAVPVLLPYKPHGSEELFYMPQTEADFPSAESSDTTMESTHTGSDDAVPPPFSSEVLGHRDPGLDRGVTIRHAEGIYSKRSKTPTFKMSESEHRGASVSAARSSQTNVTAAPESSSQVSAAFTREPPSSGRGASKRDQGTSPMPFLGRDQPEPSRRPDLPRPAAQQSSSSSSTLDQLWERFCTQWSLEESRPTRDREASLLERLERLSRLIHSTRGAGTAEAEAKPRKRREDAAGNERKKHVREAKRSVEGEAREVERKDGGGREVEGKPPIPREAWTRRLQAEEAPRPAEDDSFPSSVSPDSSQSPHLCPADRDESETLSTLSGSASTVDTARLVRVFGAHRVRRLKTSPGLGKLYRTIGGQKDGREQRRGRHAEPLHPVTPSETSATDESTVAGDSASSASTITLPSHRGPSRTLEAKRAVKRVDKGIQAGDLELVCDGTRRHTRDVGTTFPSPGEARTSGQISSPSSGLERGEQRSPSKAPGSQKQRKSRRSPPKACPPGISWFISAEELRSDARKENRPEDKEWKWSPSTAWFEPYSGIGPWREPLRQRQAGEDGNEQRGRTHREAEADLEARAKAASSGLTRLSLQEALEMRRPEFISQSRQRVRRLAQQTAERKLQEVFGGERGRRLGQPGGPGRPPKPAGTALLRRAVPRKEMIQRSKQIYENLPEVQRRRQEERRRAEYRSYRLNAQFYNKRITSRVLGRREVWQ